MLETCLTLFFPSLMIYAALSDLFSMTISNKVSLILIAGFMIFAAWTGMGWDAIAWHWAIFAIVLTAGFILFGFGLIGGGDAKLAASTALWLGWEHMIPYLTLSTLIGAGLTLLIILFRSQSLPLSIGNLEWVARIYRHGNGIPYGIALGAGALLIYPETRWMQLAIDAAILH